MNEIVSLKPGQVAVIGGRLIGRCQDCGRIVKLDGFWGGMHICVETHASHKSATMTRHKG